MDGAVESATLLLLPLSFHTGTVDRRSTFVNIELTTDLPLPMQRFDPMGDALHKRSPPSAEEEEDVTPTFRADALKALDLNAKRNKLSGLRKGEPGYLISNRPELAEEIGTDKTMINKILGAAKKETKVKLVARSAYVGRIRDALRLAPVTQITVRASRAATLRFIAELSDDDFSVFEEEVQRQSK